MTDCYSIPQIKLPIRYIVEPHVEYILIRVFVDGRLVDEKRIELDSNNKLCLIKIK